MPLSGWLYLVVHKISISIGGPNKKLGRQGGQTGNSWKRRVAIKQLGHDTSGSGGSSTSFAVLRQWGSWKPGGFFHICSQLLFSLPSSYQLEAIFLRIISFAIRRSDHRSEVFVSCAKVDSACVACVAEPEVLRPIAQWVDGAPFFHGSPTPVLRLWYNNPANRRFSSVHRPFLKSGASKTRTRSKWIKWSLFS